MSKRRKSVVSVPTLARTNVRTASALCTEHVRHTSDTTTDGHTVSTEERHLDADEMDDALDFNLDEESASHLASCRGCQYSVQWKRLAKLGQLWSDEHDWASRTIEALTERAKATGRAFVYFVPEYEKFVWRAMFPFHKSRIIKIR